MYNIICNRWWHWNTWAYKCHWSCKNQTAKSFISTYKGHYYTLHICFKV